MLGRLMNELAVGAESLATLARSGVLAPARPDKLGRMALELQRRGPLAASCSVAAIRYGDRPALIDERGPLSFREVDERSNAIARAWIADGQSSGDGVGILCRNHRGFIEATYAAAKVGLRMVLINTELAGPRIADLCDREGIEALVFDAEYADRVPRLKRGFTAWSEDGNVAGPAAATLEELAATGSGEPVAPPSAMPTVVLLTSGTTGVPKGAPRGESGSLNAAGALLERIPFRAGEAMYVAPPFFHAFGFANLLAGFAFGSTVVSRRRFDAEAMLAGVAEHGCSALIVVPSMLQRALALGPEARERHHTSRLRIIFCGGSQLPGAVATEVLDAFGDVLYVLYGSTEVAYVSISGPEDHRAAPATVGRPVRGVTLKLLDEGGHEVPPGESGRIFVSSGMEFGGYSDGRSKEVIDGLMSTGDVGHLDAEGRLFIDGRDDEMIVSGGENVFPQEVEELLAAHDQVAEAAVVGVEDPDFGARLAAYVVAAEGTEPAGEQLRDFVRENLARYKVPREVHFLSELPRNATGKVLKRELGQRCAPPRARSR